MCIALSLSILYLKSKKYQNNQVFIPQQGKFLKLDMLSKTLIDKLKSLIKDQARLIQLSDNSMYYYYTRSSMLETLYHALAEQVMLITTNLYHIRCLHLHDKKIVHHGSAQFAPETLYGALVFLQDGLVMIYDRNNSNNNNLDNDENENDNNRRPRMCLDVPSGSCLFICNDEFTLVEHNTLALHIEFRQDAQLLGGLELLEKRKLFLEHWKSSTLLRRNKRHQVKIIQSGKKNKPHIIFKKK